MKRYLDESRGATPTDLWDDLKPINRNAKERLGYPTQKPIALLNRIVSTSSKEGNLVLDPFCGCGTAAESSVNWNRRCSQSSRADAMASARILWNRTGYTWIAV